MKWILILPLFAILLAGARPIHVESRQHSKSIADEPINTKLDSLNLKMQELNDLIEKP